MSHRPATGTLGDTDADTDADGGGPPSGEPLPVPRRAAQPARCPLPPRGVARARHGALAADWWCDGSCASTSAAGVTAASAYSSFQRSMLISAIRCTLTYVVFPFVLPAVGFATGVGPWVGIVIGVVAITCDVFTIRRFFSVDHRYRWHFSAVALAVIGLLSVLLVQDVVHVVT
jgi:hypothetical protein